MIRKFLKILLWVALAVLAGATLFYLISWYGFQKERADAEFGVTFSTVMARQLGLQPRDVFDAIVDDLGAKIVRLPIYWTDVETERGKYDFSDYDYFISKAENSGIKLILAVGQKLPRWPECFVPNWVESDEYDLSRQVLEYIETVVDRYKTNNSVEMWQVENEPFHVFGSGCAKGKISASLVEEEIKLIRSLDAHRPIMLTDSGEQGIWSSSLSRADLVGVTMYRQVWNGVLKVVHFPFGPGFYSIKRGLFKVLFPDKKIIVAELQAEPWGPGKLLPDYSVELQKELMDAEQFRDNISYARRTGYDTFILWGVEWWYWLGKSNNDWEIWNNAKILMR